jgi:release factor glutamine methyltransferase
VEGERFDIILSNPPYIPTGEIPSLQQEVRHEPASALDGGDDGLDLVRGIIQGSLPLLTPGGLLMMEIGHNQAPAVKELLENARFEKVAFHRDLQGIERIASAQLPC